MKNRTLLFLLLTSFGGLNAIWNQPVNSASNIIKCRGQIPDKTACLIKPSSYKLDTYRVDICQKSPFPAFRISSDYAGSGCITLFNGKGNLYRSQLAKGGKYKLPKIGRDKIKPGTYKYLTIVLKNGFISSGKYTSGKTTWRTAGPSIGNLKTSAGDPAEFIVKLKNWRGVSDGDNDYCDNNGGTSSRCEVNYNGYQLTGIGLGEDFTETYGDKVKYMFYMIELSSPITLKEGSDGDFNITAKTNLEVYGNGVEVKSISSAPFIFQATYRKKLPQ